MRRTYSTYRQTADKPMQNYSGVQKRPFKKVRATAGGLVPYGPTRYYAPRPVGARGVTKGLDTDISALNISTNMSNSTNVIPLNLVQAGTGSWNRVGRILTMKSIRVRMNVQMYYTNNELISNTKHLRYIIIYDKQPNGTLPIKSEIIQYKDQSGNEQGTWNGYLAYDNMERFTILKDQTVTIKPEMRTFDSSGNPTLFQTFEVFEECYLKLNHVTNYKSESTPMTIADISTGALYIVYLTDDQSGDPKLNVAESYARLRYTDQ